MKKAFCIYFLAITACTVSPRLGLAQEEMEIRTIKLQHIYPDLAADLLRKMGVADWEENGGSATMEVSPRTDSLLIRATRDEFRAIESLLKDIDVEVENDPQPPEEPTATQVFNLSNISPAAAAETVMELVKYDFHFKLSAIDDNNALVIRCPQSKMSQIENIIKSIDVPPATEEGGAELPIEIFKLKHIPVAQAAAALNITLAQTTIVFRAFANDSNNSLVVITTPSGLERAQMIISHLDSPAEEPTESPSRNLSIAIDLIKATSGSREKNELPDYLKEVSEALKKNGMGNCKLYGHFMARVKEGKKFKTSGLVQSGPAQEDKTTALSSFFRVRGATIQSADLQVAEITIEATIDAPVSQQHGSDNAGNPIKRIKYQNLGIETEASVPLGDYLVLGAIPAEVGQADTVLVVIHITAD